MLSQCATVKEHAGKKKTTPENVLEALGTDAKKRNRVLELVEKNEEIKIARKAFNENLDENGDVDGEMAEEFGEEGPEEEEED